MAREQGRFTRFWIRLVTSESRGVSKGEAARRAYATVNKEDGGGKKSGSGRGRKAARSRSR